jgi:hypothetical protein
MDMSLNPLPLDAAMGKSMHGLLSGDTQAHRSLPNNNHDLSKIDQTIALNYVNYRRFTQAIQTDAAPTHDQAFSSGSTIQARQQPQAAKSEQHAKRKRKPRVSVSFDRENTMR